MPRITIETDKITLSKLVFGGGKLIDEAVVVGIIVDLVDAYDASNAHQSYSVRKHLTEALNRGK